MSRRRRAIKHTIKPDPLHNDQIVSKFINYVMQEGKKGIAEKIVYTSLGNLAKKETKEDSLELFLKVVENVKPKLEIKSRRVGGSNFQIPIEVKSERQICLALRWIVNSAKKRSGKSMIEKLTAELIDAYNSRGEAIRRKEEMHKMAEANRAFAHYVW